MDLLFITDTTEGNENNRSDKAEQREQLPNYRKLQTCKHACIAFV